LQRWSASPPATPSTATGCGWRTTGKGWAGQGGLPTHRLRLRPCEPLAPLRPLAPCTCYSPAPHVLDGL
jgi:hypothetical protein